MPINAEGLEIVEHFEGFSSTPYRCPSGLWTIGYGSIRDARGKRVTEDHPPISEEEARELLKRDLEEAEYYVNQLVYTPLTHNQLSALISFVYNIGSGNFQASTLRAKLNRGDYLGASNEFWKWRRGGGVILKGLVKRRKAEEELFLTEI